MLNLYWPVYKNLEKEVLELSNVIHFDDNQTKIYSMKIADLIVRCAIEIESIAKELYQQLGGDMDPKTDDGKSRDLYFDTDCISLIDDKWKICQKEIKISATTFYFTKTENIILMPLKNCNNRSKNKWNKAYQAIKHNRAKSLTKANLKNLLNALGALYILNLYYRNEKYLIDKRNFHIIFDDRVGSEIFSVFVAHAEKIPIGNEVSDDDIEQEVKNELNRCIYIQKYTEEAFKLMHKETVSNNYKFIEKLQSSTEVINYVQKNGITPNMHPFELAKKAGGEKLLKELFSIAEFNIRTDYEIILNKSEQIYPNLTVND